MSTLPNSYDAFITASSQRYNIPESWIRAVIAVESSGNPRAFRPEPGISDASYGLMQLLYGTARGLGYAGTPDGLFDPATNIDLGTKYLAQLRNSYGDFKRVLSAYNSGGPDNYTSNPQVAAYVQKVMNALPGIGGGFVVLLIAGYFLLKGRKS